jgi:hypothetical protein
MDLAETMAERHGRMLARVGELSLALAEDVQAAAIATPEADEKAKLAVAFQRMARSVRQAIALEARLVRDQARDTREAAREADADGARAAETRKRQVRADVERQIYCEIDAREAADWLADLDERLEEEALYDGFLDEPVETHIARLAENLGLTGEAKHNYVPRACRPRGGPPVTLSRDYAAIYDELLSRCEDDPEEEDEEEADEEEAEEEEAEEADHAPPSPSGGKRREGPEGRVAHGGSDPDPPAPPVDPDPPPPPDPGPPDPEPYIPPWERLRPGQCFPGGSGY